MMRRSGLQVLAAVFLLAAIAADVRAEAAVYFPTISTPNCTVREPIYNHTFDLTGLRTAIGYKVAIAGSSGTEFIELNVCGALQKRCDGKTEATACYTRQGREQVIGADFALKLRDGQLQFEMNGGKCNSTADYATRVQLVCRYGPVSRPIQVLTAAGCDFGLVWYTELACMRPEGEAVADAKATCSAQDTKTGHTFDLSPLASRGNNFVHGRNNETFLLNVCKPVPYQYGGMCPIGSGACLRDDTATELQKKFINIGTSVAEPLYENGKLFVHMVSNVACNGTHNYTTHISFGCDSSSMLGQPEYLNRHNCEYNFDWRTSLACISTQPCAVVDPHTAFTYDLSSLAAQQFNVTTTGNHTSGASASASATASTVVTYRFGVCNSAGAPCADGIGMCRVNGTAQQAAILPMGDFNGHMRFNQSGGAPYLLYQGGAVCGDIRRQWQARVEFVCAGPGQPEGPVLVEENEQCTVIVHFVTKLVCQKQIACKVHDWRADEEYDLTPLMSATRNYVASIGGGRGGELAAEVGADRVFYLNVCRPLVPQYGLSCPAGAAACMAANVSAMPTHERSLGDAVVGMTMVDTERGRRPQLRYYGGAQCAKDAHETLSAVIEFHCDYTARRGNPVLSHVLDECHYHFDWPTNVICAEHAVDFRPASCELHSNDTGVTFDLKSISDNGNFTIKHEPQNFDVSLCNLGDSSSTSSSSPGAGGQTSNTVLVNYAESSAKLFFQSAGPCTGKDKIDVEMRIVCAAIERHSSLSDENACTLVLIAETPLICEFLGIELDTKVIAHAIVQQAEQHSSSSVGTFLTVVLVLGTIVATVAFVLHRNPERRAQLTGWILRRDPATVQYSRVQLESEASILLPQSGRLYDSDSDDELII